MDTKPMTFTDEDLKRLKEEYPAVRPHPNGECVQNTMFCRACELTISDESKTINALLARLEAAEKAIKTWEVLSEEWHSRVRGVKDEFAKRMEKAEAMEAWRRAAGK